MADPKVAQTILDEIKRQGGKGSESLFGVGSDDISVISRALDAGITGPEIITSYLLGEKSAGGKKFSVSPGIAALNKTIDIRKQAAADVEAKKTAQNNRVAAGLEPAPPVDNTGAATSTTTTPPSKTPPQVGGMAQWLIAKGIVTADDIASMNDTTWLTALAKDAGYFEQFGGGRQFAPPSPKDVADAEAQRILNNFDPTKDLIKLPGLGNNYLIRGTTHTVDMSDPSGFNDIKDADGKPTGFKVNSKGETINVFGNKIAADAALETIKRDEETARANKANEEVAKATQAETARRNAATEQISRDQLAQQGAETQAKLQADPGNFVQREYTLANATRPSGTVQTSNWSNPNAPPPVSPYAQALSDMYNRAHPANVPSGPVSAPVWTPPAGMTLAGSVAPVVAPVRLPEPTIADLVTGKPNATGALATAGYTQQVPALATGGMTTAPQMEVGDPQAGQPVGNPEIVSNPTGAPIGVTPVNGVTGPMASAVGSDQSQQPQQQEQPNPEADTVMTISKIMALIGKLIKPGEKNTVAKDIGAILLTKLGDGDIAHGSSVAASQGMQPGGTMSQAMTSPPKFAYGTGATGVDVGSEDNPNAPLDPYVKAGKTLNAVRGVSTVAPNNYLADALARQYGFSPTPGIDVQNMPSLAALRGGQGGLSARGPSEGYSTGAFGVKLPEFNNINYGGYLDIRQDPVTFGLLSSLYKSASRSLEGEAYRAKALAPVGTMSSSLVRT